MTMNEQQLEDPCIGWFQETGLAFFMSGEAREARPPKRSVT